MKRILVLSSADTAYTLGANREFVTQITRRLRDDVIVDMLHYDDIGLHMTSSAIEAWHITSGRSLRDYDLVYFKSFYRHSEQAVSIASFCADNAVPYLCHELDQGISFTKLTQYARLSRRRLPIIPTVYVNTSRWQDVESVVRDALAFPVVFKAAGGRGGDHNFLVNTFSELTQIAQRYAATDFVAQKFVPNDYDLRVLVVGGEIKLIIKRQRQDDSTHLNNTSKGAESQLMTVDQLGMQVQEVVLQAAAEFQREIAGVDIMFDKNTGAAWILEVNASPQVATGAFRQEKLDVYAELFTQYLDD